VQKAEQDGKGDAVQKARAGSLKARVGKGISEGEHEWFHKRVTGKEKASQVATEAGRERVSRQACTRREKKHTRSGKDAWVCARREKKHGLHNTPRADYGRYISKIAQVL
jgi:hypothetical protein